MLQSMGLQRHDRATEQQYVSTGQREGPAEGTAKPGAHGADAGPVPPLPGVKNQHLLSRVVTADTKGCRSTETTPEMWVLSMDLGWKGRRGLEDQGAWAVSGKGGGLTIKGSCNQHFGSEFFLN